MSNEPNKSAANDDVEFATGGMYRPADHAPAIDTAVDRYGATWDESKHKRGQPDNAGQFSAGELSEKAEQSSKEGNHRKAAKAHEEAMMAHEAESFHARRDSDTTKQFNHEEKADQHRKKFHEHQNQIGSQERENSSPAASKHWLDKASKAASDRGIEIKIRRATGNLPDAIIIDQLEVAKDHEGIQHVTGSISDLQAAAKEISREAGGLDVYIDKEKHRAILRSKFDAQGPTSSAKYPDGKGGYTTEPPKWNAGRPIGGLSDEDRLRQGISARNSGSQ